MGCVLRWVPPATRGPAPLPQADEQLSQLQHERADLLRRVDEDQEDLNELMAKHKALIAQVGAAGEGGALQHPPPWQGKSRSILEHRSLDLFLFFLCHFLMQSLKSADRQPCGSLHNAQTWAASPKGL